MAGDEGLVRCLGYGRTGFCGEVGGEVSESDPGRLS